MMKGIARTAPRMAIWLIALSAQLALAVLPEPDQVHIDVIHSASNATGEIFDSQITQTAIDFKGSIHRIDSLPAQHTHEKAYNALIIIGDEALARINAWPTGYGIVIAVHVSPAEFTAKQALKTPAGTHITALFSGAPVKRQLHLAQLVMPRARAWAIPYQPVQQQALDEALRQAPDGMTLTPYAWSDEKDVIKRFQIPLHASDAVLALSSLDAVTPDSIRGLLLSAYRQGKPVIGMDAAYVRSGVLAAVDTSTEQYTLEAERILRDWLAEKTLPSADYPSIFSVYINRHVAQSLDLLIPDEQTLTDALRQQETSP